MPYHIQQNRGGGAEVQSWLLAKELARHGFEVSYIAQSVKGKEGRQERFHGVLVRWVRYAHHFRWSNGVEYYKALREENPDLVIQRTSSFVTGVVGLYCKMNKKKFVWICTDNDSPVKWMFLKKQINLNRQKREHRLKRLVLLFNALIYDLSRHFGMNCIAYPFTQNEFQQRALRDFFGIDSFRMISGHKEPERILSPEHKLNNSIVLWVANLGSNKQPEKFLELARLCKDTSLRFVMIGGRMDPKYIESLFKEKPDNLEWLGRRPFDETLEWFEKATFLVNTSRKEGFPNTYVQAWLRGIPVLSLGADPDGVIQKFKLGYVCNDVANLLQTIYFLMKHEKEYIEMSKRIIEYANLHHSIKTMTDNFLSITYKQKHSICRNGRTCAVLEI